MPARILIVEDNPANLELMVYLLTASGHKTLVATNGAQGLEIARDSRPDLVVCDIQMPAMNGYEMVQALKADNGLRSIPIVAVTAFAMVGDRDKALTAGFDDYVSKPIEPEKFVSQIEQLLPLEMRTAPRAEQLSVEERIPHREHKGRTILIVDDTQENLNLTQYLFSNAGYEVISTRTAFEAFSLARQTNPDLIISDVTMPATSGYDFIAAIKADDKLRTIPFLFLTSTATSEANRSRGLALGAAGYLSRPIDPEVLLAEVAACFKD
ncbi:response regulator [Woeseia oceani]|uniref:Response regulatory domain-containing protein n=1 Tax=Woeseia oceani TaxID=1548547 RepID=A0A193LDJ1_9GAMM|nr:response regulator [Woeseia oceani]ANO50506.1 hypothetical protein BA177_04115 [Woeseia oceani]